MTQTGMATIVVDAMGGDDAPGVVLAGTSAALAADSHIRVFLAGDAAVVEPFCAEHDRAEPLITTQVIGMDEHPAGAVRSKKDSSIVAGCRHVRSGHADAFFSAGSTGACMAAATLVMGRIKGVSRPAIAAVLPTGDSPVVLLDVGANADCKPENLLQFAHMGAAYARVVLEVSDVRIGLLNIGEESSKGSTLAQDSYALMANDVSGFVGNVEGRDLTTGTADVIVTDGFTGNVALKLIEGVSISLLGEVKAALLSTPASRLAAIAARQPMRRLRDKLDPDTYGGAPLLGVDGVCIIGHGSATDRAVAAAILVAARAIRGDLAESIAAAVSR